MNVSLITEDRDVAREKLRALRRQLHRRADAEYEALAAGYEALVEGKPVLSLEHAMRECGFDEKGRPRLAIARGDRRQVHFRFGRNWSQEDHEIGYFDSGTPNRRGGRLAQGAFIEVNLDRRSPLSQSWHSDGYALVPIVPAEVVAVIGGGSNLRHFYTLWEVEEWSDTRIGTAPDRDPYLLRHLGGDLYAVIAEWDLTELERLVMAARRNG